MLHRGQLRDSERGFNMVELLLVIAVFGILAAVILGASLAGRQKAEDNRIRNSIRQMRWLAEEVFDTQGGNYQDWAQHSSIAARLATLEAEIDDVHGGTNNTTLRETQANDYCISAPLASNSLHYCVDASGAFKTASSACPDLAENDPPLVCPSS